MKRKLSILLSLVAGVAVVSLAADLPGAKPQKEQDGVQELRAQIAELRAKIQGLESQTKNLESTVEQLKRSPAPTPLNLFQSPTHSTVTPSADGARPPKIWGQREVNGWTCYIVPCEQQSR